MHNILLVDDQPVVLLGIESVITKTLDKFEPHFAETIPAMEKLLGANDFQVVIIGPNIARYDNTALLLKALAPHNNLSAIFFVADMKSFPLKQLYKVGLRAVIEKDASFRTIQEGLKAIVGTDPQFYISEKLKMQMVDLILDPPSKILPQLTSKERIISQMLTNGKNNKQIGELLSLKPSTVSTFKTRIFSKLNINNLIELSNVYRSQGIS